MFRMSLDASNSNSQTSFLEENREAGFGVVIRPRLEEVFFDKLKFPSPSGPNTYFVFYVLGMRAGEA